MSWRVAALHRQHTQFLGRLHAELGMAASAAGAAGQQAAVTTTAFRARSGAQSAKTQTRFGLRPSRGSGWTIALSNRARHATFLEFGTRPHAIVARLARYLRFRINGVLMFRRRVWHPGTKPTMFLRAAARHAHRVLGDEALAAMRRAIR